VDSLLINVGQFLAGTAKQRPEPPPARGADCRLKTNGYAWPAEKPSSFV